MAKRAYYEGTVGDDYLYGTNYADQIYGLGGRDSIYAYSGNDYVSGGEGSDTIFGMNGNDELNGGSGADRYVFSGYWGQDEVYDYSSSGEQNTLFVSDMYSSEVYFTESGDDLYIEFYGRGDYIRIESYEYNKDAYRLELADGEVGFPSPPPPPPGATDGADILNGTTGGDNIDGLGGNDTIDGLDGDDFLSGNVGDDVVGGNYGNDTVYGNAGNDRVNGAYGDDLVYGGDGNDNVRGGPGYDLLYGGTGQDDFDFDLVTDSVVGSRRDEIFTFVRGQDDIDITAIGTGKSGQAAFKFVDTKAFTAAGQVRETVINGDTVVQGNTDADRTPEFEIGLDGRFNLAASDFAL